MQCNDFFYEVWNMVWSMRMMCSSVGVCCVCLCVFVCVREYVKRMTEHQNQLWLDKMKVSFP